MGKKWRFAEKTDILSILVLGVGIIMATELFIKPENLIQIISGSSS